MEETMSFDTARREALLAKQLAGEQLGFRSPPRVPKRPASRRRERAPKRALPEAPLRRSSRVAASVATEPVVSGFVYSDCLAV